MNQTATLIQNTNNHPSNHSITTFDPIQAPQLPYSSNFTIIQHNNPQNTSRDIFEGESPDKINQNNSNLETEFEAESPLNFDSVPEYKDLESFCSNISQDSCSWRSLVLEDEELLSSNIPKRNFSNSSFQRNQFSIQVFSLLSLIYCSVTLCVIVSNMSQRIQQSLSKDIIFYIIASIFGTVNLAFLACSKSIARSEPTNYIMISLFTLCLSYVM